VTLDEVVSVLTEERLHLSTWAAALGYELELDLKTKQREVTE
jgi:hypothetical protein